MKRREAKALGLSRYTSGKSCLYGHAGERFVSTAECCECKAAYNAKPEAKAAQEAYNAKPEAKAARAAFYREKREAARAAANLRQRTFVDAQLTARDARLIHSHSDTPKQYVRYMPMCHALEIALEDAHHYEAHPHKALAGLEAKQHRAAVARVFNKLPESDLE